MDLSSSNLREFTNQVESLETMGKQGLLDGIEVFFFTDNSTCEAAAYNGSSKSELLFELVLRLHKLEMKYRCRIHIIHCSGERMKAQGSDGLSRGNITTGVMAGKKMIDFIPIHLTALERSADLKTWLCSWLPPSVEFLEAKACFIRGHDIVPGGYSTNCDGMKIPTTKPGTFVWSPPPIIGDVAVEELRKARHKRQQSMHVFIIPRLLMGEFKNELGTRNHIMVVGQSTKSGLPVETWLRRLVQVLMRDGLSTTVGPVMCNKEGYVLCSGDFNSELRDMVYRCAQQHPSLLDVNADLENDFRVYRSFRRGATTCARNNKVQEADIDVHNRWRATKAKGGSLPNMSMQNLYTEISQALPTRLRFSASL